MVSDKYNMVSLRSYRLLLLLFTPKSTHTPKKKKKISDLMLKTKPE